MHLKWVTSVASAAVSETIKKHKQNFLDGDTSITSGSTGGTDRPTSWPSLTRPGTWGSTVSGSGPVGMYRHGGRWWRKVKAPSRIVIKRCHTIRGGGFGARNVHFKWACFLEHQHGIKLARLTASYKKIKIKKIWWTDRMNSIPRTVGTSWYRIIRNI